MLHSAVLQIWLGKLLVVSLAKAIVIGTELLCG